MVGFHLLQEFIDLNAHQVIHLTYLDISKSEFTQLLRSEFTCDLAYFGVLQFADKFHIHIHGPGCEMRLDKCGVMVFFPEKFPFVLVNKICIQECCIDGIGHAFS